MVLFQGAYLRRVHGTGEDEKIGGDAEAAAREGGDEAAGGEESRVEGQRIFPAAKRLCVK